MSKVMPVTEEAPTPPRRTKMGMLTRVFMWLGGSNSRPADDEPESGGFRDPNSTDDADNHHLHFHFYGQSHRLSARQSSRNSALEVHLSARLSDRRSATVRRSIRSSRSSRRSRGSRLGSITEGVAAPAAAPEAASASVTEPATVSAEASQLPPATAEGPEDVVDAAAPAPKLHPLASVGWCGTSYELPLVDGVHEHRAAIAKRRRLRLLPEINSLISALWGVAVKRGVRMDLKAYMDYHLSCYYFVTAMDANEEVSTLDKASISLCDAWENAICDWVEDTELMKKQYGNRSLHYDSFRDSVFELIDLYTPTTDEKQYVGYLRRLVRQISVVDARGVPLSWRHQWPKGKVATKAARKLAGALRASIAREEGVSESDVGEEMLHRRFGEWHTAQEDARKQDIRDEAAALGEAEFTPDKMDALYEKWDELMPRGLDAACEEIIAACAAGDAPPFTLPTDEYERERAIISLLRLLDVDLSGGLTSGDLVASLRDGTDSAWLTDKAAGRSRLHAAKSMAIKKGR